MKNKKMISYPKIKQFRDTVQKINYASKYIGMDDNNEPIFNELADPPIVTCHGTVKLHGTNGSVCYNNSNGMWTQSRRGILSEHKDNAGFWFFTEKNKKQFKTMFDDIADHYEIDTEIYTISIYGEWVGKGIQKGVGIAEIEKAFFIFGLKISNLEDEDERSYWLPSHWLENPEYRIFNIENFKTYKIKIDFSKLPEAVNTLSELTLDVEKECPVSKALGNPNKIGEGIVWTCEYKNSIYRFKTKGEKHSNTKVKKIVSVDIEKLNTVQSFIDYAVTENRFTQAIENVYDNDTDLDIKKLGELIKWMKKDIISEEIDTLAKNGLEPSDIDKFIAEKVKKLYFIRVNENIVT